MPDTQSDESLVARSLQGDQSAFAVLVARYQTLVCSVAYAITGDFSRSEDVGQESFLVAWQNLANLEDATKFKAWVCGVTRNLARNANRRVAKHGHVELPNGYSDSTATTEERLMQNEQEGMVWQSLESLPLNYREPLVLFYRQDQSVAEVATALELSQDAVKQRLSRGRQMLRAEVTATVERTLRSTAPTKAFTLAVLAALPALSGKAAAATVGTAATAATAVATKHTAGLGALKGFGAAGTVFGPMLGLLGGLLGMGAGWSAARYQSQRTLIVRAGIAYLVGSVVFSIPYLAMRFGWKPWEVFGTPAYGWINACWVLGFMVLNGFWMLWLFRRERVIVREAKASQASELPGTRLKSFLNQYEGRRWSSRRRLWGLPLVDVAISDPDAQPSQPPEAGLAHGWIAIGDRAIGRLLAIGTFARAPIAFGVISIGVASFGVISLGLASFGVISFGGLAIGVVASAVLAAGVFALGYYAAGVIALGWKAAQGVLAAAFQYAEGVQSYGQHAGDEVAKEWIANSVFLSTANAALLELSSMNLLPYSIIGAVTVLGLSRLAYRRKESRDIESAAAE